VDHGLQLHLVEQPTGLRLLGTIRAQERQHALAAQGTGAAVLLSATSLGYPLSTTQVISGAIMGSGAAKRVSAVRWGIAGNILTAWALTLPASAIVGAAAYGVCDIFGREAVGPVLVAVCGVSFLLSLFGRRSARLDRGPMPSPTAGAAS